MIGIKNEYYFSTRIHMLRVSNLHVGFIRGEASLEQSWEKGCDFVSSI